MNLRWGEVARMVGPALAVFLLAGGWTLVRRQHAQAEATLYGALVAEAGRLVVGDDAAPVLAATQQQAQEARRRDMEVSARCVRLLPEYQDADALNGVALMGRVAAAVTQAAASRKPVVPIPRAFDGVLPKEEGPRLLHLAKAQILRMAMEAALDAGITRIHAAALGSAESDPSGVLAVLSPDLDVEGPSSAVLALIHQFERGENGTPSLGVRQVTVEPVGASEKGARSSLRLRCGLSALVVQDPRWGLVPSMALPPASGRSSMPAVPTAGSAVPGRGVLGLKP
jgi:hypothetical protein